MTMRYDGRVALITGAGAGLGRQYALLLARRGAAVVVNDLGGDPHGVGASSRAADLVVKEIEAFGGKAVANYDSVESGEKLIQTALDNYGRIDIVINNAGILRDRTVGRMSDDDWDLVHRVHLRGSFLVTRAAWPHMRKQNYGRIILTSSASGLYGNFGQANYSAAKLGLVGLSNTLALEGEKYNILCNVIAPMAGSRMTENIMPPDLFAALKPDYVAPLVAFLCHEECTENGGIFESAAGWVGKLRWERTRGKVLRSASKEMSVESVRDGWSDVVDWKNSSQPASMTESTSHFTKVLADMDKDPVQEQVASADEYTYTDRDVLLYALSVGVSTTQQDHMRFLYEGADKFAVLPTFGVLVGFKAIMNTSFPSYLKVDMSRLLHGEQYLELDGPLPTSGTLQTFVRQVNVIDKGSGAVVISDLESFDSSGRRLIFSQIVTFLGGAGGFGGPRNSTALRPIVTPPSRKADFIVEQLVSVDQAALYRLNGDRNPLHIDPSFAALGGQSTPILHGLCALGYAVRHVLARYAQNDVSLFRAVKVRFSKPVLPGQTLMTEMWREDKRIHFRCKVKESSQEVLSGCYVDLHSVLDVIADSPTTSISSTESSAPRLQSDSLFEQLSVALKARSDLVAKVQAMFLWKIKSEGKVVKKWTLDLKNGSGDLYPGDPLNGAKADCTLEMDDADLLLLFSGKLNPQKAFMSGKLRLQGNIMLSQKLGSILNEAAKL